MKHCFTCFLSCLCCFLILVCIAFTSVICGGVHTDHTKEAFPVMAQVEEVTQASQPTAPVLTETELQLLYRLISAECAGEPFECRVAVAAVVYNRMRLNRGAGSLTDAIFAPFAFESVAEGEIGCAADATDLSVSRLAAALAAEEDPTGGALRCAHSGSSAAHELEVTYTSGGMVFGR